MKSAKIPRAVVYRLSLYLRALSSLASDGVKTVSSARFGDLVGVKPAQLRKDLAHFGQFGVKGVGYDVQKLSAKIIGILGTDKTHKVALVGVGNLGRALLAYKGFSSRGFVIAAAFDSALAGKKLEITGLPIVSPGEMPDAVRKEKIQLGIIAVPAASAQKIADAMVRSGIKGILNFAPVRLVVPAGVRLENIDLSVGLESLSFALKDWSDLDD